MELRDRGSRFFVLTMGSCAPENPVEAAKAARLPAAVCGEGEGAEPTTDSTWFRIALSLALAGQGMVFGLGYNNALRAGEAPPHGSGAYLAIHGGLFLSVLVVALLLGGPLVRHFFAAIRRRRLSVESLFVLSALGAFVGSVISSVTGVGDVYYEVVAVVLCVYTIGKRIGLRHQGRVLSAANAVGEAFDKARRRHRGGFLETVSVAQLRQGDLVEVAPGEAITVDGIVESGRGYVDETSITGEPRPVPKEPGATVRAGAWSVDGALLVRVQAAGGARVLDGVLRTLRAARAAPSAFEKQADHILAWFVPIVASVSAGTFLGWLVLSDGPWWSALFNSMAVLLVACPCALGLATPMAVWSSLQTMAMRGFVARNARLVDVLAQTRTVVFDKTGTLSLSSQGVAEEYWGSDAESERDSIRSAVKALEERAPHHPVARALLDHIGDVGFVRTASVRIVPGQGIEGEVGGDSYRIGERVFALGSAVVPDWADWAKSADDGAIWVARSGRPLACFVLREHFRQGLHRLFADLKERGIDVHILTGDPHPPEGLPAAGSLQSGLLPEDKVRFVRAERDAGRAVLFIGDGINDAGAMAEATGSIAMGDAASLARATADAVYLGQDFAALPDVLDQARAVRAALRGNLLFALFYNGIGMALAAAGMLHPVVAALLMVGSSALVSIRAIRSARPVSPLCNFLQFAIAVLRFFREAVLRYE